MEADNEGNTSKSTENADDFVSNNKNKEIKINPKLISKLDEEYSTAFKHFAEGLNKQISETKDVTVEQVADIQKSFEDLVKDMRGLKPRKNPSEEKMRILRGSIRNLLKKLVRNAIPGLPSSSRTVKVMRPILGPFNSKIQEQLESFIKDTVAEIS